VPDRFDAVLANPPYVADGERARLAPEIVRHEPGGALFAGPDGLAVIAPLARQLGALDRLRCAAIEVGDGQAQAVSRLLREAGFDATGVEVDLGGIKRVVIGRKGRG